MKRQLQNSSTSQLPLKIGLDATPLVSLSGGIGFYLFYLLDELIPMSPDKRFIFYAPSDQGDIAHFKKYESVEIRVRPFLSSCHSLWGQTTLSLSCYQDEIDLFWGTTQSIPLLRSKKMKTLFTLYDFVYLLYPETVSTIKCVFQKKLTQRMLTQASCCMAISQATAQKLKAYYDLDCTLILTPPHKPQIEKKPKEQAVPFLKQKGLRYKSYVLTVSTLEPRKNLELLLEKYQSLLEQHEREKILPLVIVGGGGWKNSALLHKLTQLQARYPSHLIRTGKVPDTELAVYLSGAHCLISLSLYEGYGMPIQEARICGTPIAAWDRPEMREAAENDGIFLTEDTLDVQLRAIFLEQEPMQVSQTGYANNQAKAQKIHHLLHQLEGRDECSCNPIY